MKSNDDLLVAPCTRRAAEYAVMNWHYSKKMPTGRTVYFGVWEKESFIGVVVFGVGVTSRIGMRFDLRLGECIELVRIALKTHFVTVTKIIKESIKLLRKQSPKVQLIISYADSNQKHLGKIYQASNWFYIGTSQTPMVKTFGKIEHSRTIIHRYGRWDLNYLKTIDPNAEYVKTGIKYKYAMPLNKRMRRLCEKMAKPYPKELPV